MELKMTKSILTSRPLAGRSSTTPRPAAGFTLLELMVSVAIMAVIMLAFGGLLTQANQVVSEGEKRMRADAAASAISRIIRNDIRKMTKNGFCRIGEDVLAVVVAGKSQSLFSEESGDGAVVIYGHHEPSNTLFRKVLVLSPDAPTGAADKIIDCLVWKGKAMTLAQLQVLDDERMKNLIDDMDDKPDSLAWPPQTLYQVTNTTWMVLAGGCTKLQISYRSPGETNWSTATATHTRHNQTSWPTAIKFNFVLQANSLIGSALTDEDEIKGEVPYEIICPIGH